MSENRFVALSAGVLVIAIGLAIGLYFGGLAWGLTGLLCWFGVQCIKIGRSASESQLDQLTGDARQMTGTELDALGIQLDRPVAPGHHAARGKLDGGLDEISGRLSSELDAKRKAASDDAPAYKLKASPNIPAFVSMTDKAFAITERTFAEDPELGGPTELSAHQRNCAEILGHGPLRSLTDRDISEVYWQVLAGFDEVHAHYRKWMPFKCQVNVVFKLLVTRNKFGRDHYREEMARELEHFAKNGVRPEYQQDPLG